MDAMEVLRTKKISMLLFYMIICGLSMTNAQIKKGSASHLEQGEFNSNEADTLSKESSSLHTIEGKVKLPSPKVSPILV